MNFKSVNAVEKEQNGEGNPLLKTTPHGAQPQLNNDFVRDRKPTHSKTLPPGIKELLADVWALEGAQCQTNLVAIKEQQKEEIDLGISHKQMPRQHATKHKSSELKMQNQENTTKHGDFDILVGTEDSSLKEKPSQAENSHWQKHFTEPKYMSGFPKPTFTTLNYPNLPLRMLLSPKPLAAVQGRRKSPPAHHTPSSARDQKLAKITKALKAVSWETLMSFVEASDIIKDYIYSHRVGNIRKGLSSDVDQLQENKERAAAFIFGNEISERAEGGIEDGIFISQTNSQSQQKEIRDVCEIGTKTPSFQKLPNQMEELSKEARVQKGTECHRQNGNSFDTAEGVAKEQEGDCCCSYRSLPPDDQLKSQSTKRDFKRPEKAADSFLEDKQSQQNNSTHQQNLSLPKNQENISKPYVCPMKNPQNIVNASASPEPKGSQHENLKCAQNMKSRTISRHIVSRFIPEPKEKSKNTSKFTPRSNNVRKVGPSNKKTDHLEYDKPNYSEAGSEKYTGTMSINICSDESKVRRKGAKCIVQPHSPSTKSEMDGFCELDRKLISGKRVTREIVQMLDEPLPLRKRGYRCHQENAQKPAEGIHKQQDNNWCSSYQAQFQSSSNKHFKPPPCERALETPDKLVGISSQQGKTLHRRFSQPNISGECNDVHVSSRKSTDSHSNAMVSPRHAVTARRRHSFVQTIRARNKETTFQRSASLKKTLRCTDIKSARKTSCSCYNPTANSFQIPYNLPARVCSTNSQTVSDSHAINAHAACKNNANCNLISGLPTHRFSSLKSKKTNESIFRNNVIKDINCACDIVTMSTNRNNKSDDNDAKDSASKSKGEDQSSYHTAPAGPANGNDASPGNEIISGRKTGSEGKEGGQSKTEKSMKKRRKSTDSLASQKSGERQGKTYEKPEEINGAHGPSSKLSGSGNDEEVKQEGEDFAWQEDKVCMEGYKQGSSDNDAIDDPLQRAACLCELLEGCSMDIEIDLYNKPQEVQPPHCKRSRKESWDGAQCKRYRKSDKSRDTKSHRGSPTLRSFRKSSQGTRCSPRPSRAKPSRKSTRISARRPSAQEHSLELTRPSSPNPTQQSAPNWSRRSSRENSREQHLCVISKPPTPRESSHRRPHRNSECVSCSPSSPRSPRPPARSSCQNHQKPKPPRGRHFKDYTPVSPPPLREQSCDTCMTQNPQSPCQDSSCNGCRMSPSTPVLDPICKSCSCTTVSFLQPRCAMCTNPSTKMLQEPTCSCFKMDPPKCALDPMCKTCPTASTQSLQDPCCKSFMSRSTKPKRNPICNNCATSSAKYFQDSFGRNCATRSPSTQRGQNCTSCTSGSTKLLRDPICKSCKTAAPSPLLPRQPQPMCTSTLSGHLGLSQDLKSYICRSRLRSPVSLDRLTAPPPPRAKCCPVPGFSSSQDRSCPPCNTVLASSSSSSKLCSRPILATSIMSPRMASVSPRTTSSHQCKGACAQPCFCPSCLIYAPNACPPRLPEMSVLKRWQHEMSSACCKPRY